MTNNCNVHKPCWTTVNAWIHWMKSGAEKKRLNFAPTVLLCAGGGV